jgi:stage V sporulation protein G
MGVKIRITEVRVTPRWEDRLRGYATVTLGGVFVVRGLKIIEGKSGRLFVAMPSRKKPDGTFQDICHPIERTFRELLEKEILTEYTRSLRAGAGDAVGTGDAAPPPP